MGKCPINNSTDNRRILVKLQYIADKEKLLRERPNIISNYRDKRENQDEKLHQYFCKWSLDITKYASNTAVSAEMGRFPITHKAWGQSIKYWVRLESGTGNKLLNEAFYQTEIITSGLKVLNIYCVPMDFVMYGWTPGCYDLRCFHKAFIERLNDQYRGQSILVH